MNPKVAKANGRRLKLRKDWEEIKFDVMWYVVFQKFDQNTDLAKMLVETSGMFLIEGNTWNDRYWGACLKKVPVKDKEIEVWYGDNRLGQILMQVRKIVLEEYIPVYKKMPKPSANDDSGPFRVYPSSYVSISRPIHDIAHRHSFNDYYTTKMSVINMMMDNQTGLMDQTIQK